MHTQLSGILNDISKILAEFLGGCPRTHFDRINRISSWKGRLLETLWSYREEETFSDKLLAICQKSSFDIAAWIFDIRLALEWSKAEDASAEIPAKSRSFLAFPVGVR
jgi:hypothetical protein